MPLLESRKSLQRWRKEMDWAMDKKWAERDEQWPRCCREGGRDRALALANLTADILDISGSSFREFCGSGGREVHTAGACRGFEKRSWSGWWMLVECSRNVGWGFLGAACLAEADVASGEITGSSFHHCLPFSLNARASDTSTHTDTHSSGKGKV